MGSSKAVFASKHLVLCLKPATLWRIWNKTMCSNDSPSRAPLCCCEALAYSSNIVTLGRLADVLSNESLLLCWNYIDPLWPILVYWLMRNVLSASGMFDRREEAECQGCVLRGCHFGRKKVTFSKNLAWLGYCSASCSWDRTSDIGKDYSCLHSNRHSHCDWERTLLRKSWISSNIAIVLGLGVWYC